MRRCIHKKGLNNHFLPLSQLSGASLFLLTPLMTHNSRLPQTALKWGDSPLCGLKWYARGDPVLFPAFISNAYNPAIITRYFPTAFHNNPAQQRLSEGLCTANYRCVSYRSYQ